MDKSIANMCLEGMRKLQNQSENTTKPANFKDWVLSNFGEGFYNQFFRPYNEKLFQCKLEQLTTDWMGMFVPKPSFEEIEKGSTGNNENVYGYNATFYYPERGGIQSLADAMVSHKGITVRTNCTVEAINLAGKYVVYNDPLKVTRQRVYYNNLVNTLPLPVLIDLIEDLGNYDKSRKDYLKYTTVYNLNLAIDRPNIDQGRHWVYYPEAKYSFYRIGFCNSFNPTAGPEGTSSISVEVACKERYNDYSALDNLIETDLIQAGVLKPTDKVLEKCQIVISPAYVIFDHNRNQAVEELAYRLDKESIYLAGRFGAWRYSFMEADFLDGKAVAEKIDGETVGGITKRMLGF